MARILFSKIRPSREILKIRDGTPLEAEEILTYIKKLSKRIGLPSREILKIRDGTPLEMPSREILKIRDVHKKRVARILFSKIRPSREILKIRDGTPLEAEEILTYIKKLSKRISYFYSKLDIPSNVVQKKRVARILFSKIRPSREILKIRDGTPLETEEILTYIKKLSKRIEMARILFSKIRPSREILKIRDGTPLEAEEILTYIRKLSKRIGLPSREILKIRDGTPLEAEKILTYIKKLSKRIEILKIRDGTPLEWPSREILKIRDGTPLEAEEILTYIKKLSKRIGLPSREILKIRDGTFGGGGNFDIHKKALETDRPSREILKIRDGTPLEILFSKIRPSREILKIRDGTPLEKKRVARILFSKIRPSREILKIRDGTPLEAEEILTYIKKISKRISYFYSKLDIPSNVVQKKRVARILFSKIRPSREILKIRDGTPLEAEEILTYIKKLSKRIEPSREILKIRDGTPLEAEEILTYIRKLSKRIEPSREILKIRDGTFGGGGNFDIHKKALETDRPSREILKIRDEILKIRDVQKKRVARILFSKIRPSREILKIRDGTPLEAEEILTYIKKISKRISYFYSKLDIPSNVVQKKRVARILFSKIRPSREILKIRDGTPLEAEEILTYIKKLSKRIEPSREILKIRDGTPLEAEEILTYIRKLSKRIEILKFRDGTPLEWPSREILKIRDDVPSNVVQKKRVARILFSKIRPSREILKIRDGTPLEAEEILTYIKSSQNGSVCYFYSKLDVPSNVVHKKRVAQILFSKIRPSREILEIRDGTPLEVEEILTYIKKISKRIGLLLF
ncbi:hypothetical protein OROMI_001755 [Orobanche minor]